jgi:hypothetical protein
MILCMNSNNPHPRYPFNIINLMLTNLLISLSFLLTTIMCDAPEPWQLGFQDGASPSFEGITELHDYILFYLIIILQGVGVILSSVVLHWNAQVNKIVHKYHNHGHKCQRLSQAKRLRHYSIGSRRGIKVNPKVPSLRDGLTHFKFRGLRLKQLPSQDQLCSAC